MTSVYPPTLQLFATLDIKPWDLPREQIREFVRSLILSHTLGAGMPIPSTRQLGILWKKDPTTVHLALADLVKEGLLIRRSGKGTFVADRGQHDIPAATVLKSLGIYRVHSTRPLEMETSQALCRRLQDTLAPRNVEIRMWTVDEDSDRATPPASLIEAVQNGEIQGLIVPSSSGDEIEWMQKLPIAIAHITTNKSVHNRVMPDEPTWLRLSLGALKEQGCQSVGFISTFASKYVEFYDLFLEIAGELGLKTRNEWLRMPDLDYVPPSMAGYGYRQFQEIWAGGHRPDGLLVWPDHVASGTVTAILEKRLHVPEDLKLVLHVNDATAYPCPLPATLLVTKIGRWADELLKMVEAQLAGQEVSPVWLDSLLLPAPLEPGYLP